MKKNSLQKTSALRKLTLRRETIQQLTAEEIDIAGGWAKGGGPTSNEISCPDTNCGSFNSWLGRCD